MYIFSYACIFTWITNIYTYIFISIPMLRELCTYLLGHPATHLAQSAILATSASLCLPPPFFCITFSLRPLRNRVDVLPQCGHSAGLSKLELSRAWNLVTRRPLLTPCDHCYHQWRVFAPFEFIGQTAGYVHVHQPPTDAFTVCHSAVVDTQYTLMVKAVIPITSTSGCF